MRERTVKGNSVRRKCWKKLAAGLLAGILMVAQVQPAQAGRYDKYPVTPCNWGLGRNTAHKTPGTAYAKVLKGKNAYYYVSSKPKKKRIYLSFDCGYENGHTASILDTLKRKNVKAIFFVTKGYLESSPKLVRRMKKEGHLVGNHTMNHPAMAGLSPKRIRQEILGCERLMKKLTGYEMDRYIRPPMGNFSARSLKVTKDLGYTTILWSMAFYDYDTANQPGRQAIIDQFMTYYHPGAITLFHAVSDSDDRALGSIIHQMRLKDYRFGTLDELN